MKSLNIGLLLLGFILVISSCCEITGDCNTVEPPLNETKEIEVSGTLDFGIVRVGEQTALSFTIKNIGSANLSISSINVPDGYFLDWNSGTILVNDEVVVGIIFEPQTVENYDGTISVFSDAQGGTNSITVTGEGTDTYQFTDSRDGTEYDYIQIGNMFWMTQNLNYQTPNSLCYDNSNVSCNQYGRLYDVQEIMQGESPSNNVPSGVQSICPDGWHLPSNAEFQALIDEYDDGNSNNGMDEVYDALIDGGDSGFDFLLGGYIIWGNVFQSEGSATLFWTSSTTTWNLPEQLRFSSLTKNVQFVESASSEMAYCRCVQD